jgi:hypothetical protein
MTAPLSDRSAQARYDVGYDRSVSPRSDGDGMLAYSVVLLSIAGVLNMIGGIAAISDSHFYVHGTHYAVGTLKTWGWIITFIGAIELFAAWGIYRKNQVARWVGVLVLSINAIVQLLNIPSYPFWSLSIFALDLIAIYGLVAYGSKPRTA